MAPPFEQTGDVLVAFYSDNLLSSLAVHAGLRAGRARRR